MKIINKYLIAISIIAIIACGSYLTAAIVNSANENKVISEYFNVNVGEAAYITLDGTPFANLDKSGREAILGTIASKIAQLPAKDRFEVSAPRTDDLDNSYLKIKAKIRQKYDVTLENIAETTISGVKTKYDMRIYLEATPIKTSVTYNNQANIDLNNIDSNTDYILANVQANDFSEDETHYEHKPIANQYLKVRLTNLDNLNDSVKDEIGVYTDLNGNAKINFKDLQCLINGRPGKYQLNVYFHDDSKYIDSMADINLVNPNYYKINSLEGNNFSFITTESNFGKTFPFQVTDYYNTSIANKEILINDQKFTTDSNGVVNYQVNAAFKDLKIDDEQNITVKLATPSVAGEYRSGTSDVNIITKRVAGTDKSICIRTQGSGTVFDKKTFNAPNGMSISAKGGIFGSIAQYRIQWFNADKQFIGENKETYYESGASDRRFYVPNNAVYMKIRVGTTDSGKAKPETDFLGTGNAIIFFEGAAGTENVHIAAQNANGYEILRKDYKC